MSKKSRGITLEPKEILKKEARGVETTQMYIREKRKDYLVLTIFLSIFIGVPAVVYNRNLLFPVVMLGGYFFFFFLQAIVISTKGIKTARKYQDDEYLDSLDIEFIKSQVQNIQEKNSKKKYVDEHGNPYDPYWRRYKSN